MPPPVRVLIVASHVVQYEAPLYRLLAKDPALDLAVAYCSLDGARPFLDAGFATSVRWDVPLLDGYRWQGPRNLAARPSIRRFWGLWNPGLARIVRHGRFEVVACHGYHRASFWLAALAARAAGSRIAVYTDATTLSSQRQGGAAKRLLKRAIVPRIYRAADAVLARSTRASAFVASLGVPAARVLPVPYAIDTAAFAGPARALDRGAARLRLGLAAEGRLALFAGKLVPWKRVDDLLAALARSPRWSGVVAGDGPLRAALEARARALGLAERVRFLGFVNQQALPLVYAAADVLVLPSSFEPFGLVVGEAMASGRPAIVSDACGAADDLVGDGDSGFVYPAGDIPALADRLDRLAALPPSHLDAGAAARARLCSLDRVASLFRAAIEAIARAR